MDIIYPTDSFINSDNIRFANLYDDCTGMRALDTNSKLYEGFEYLANEVLKLYREELFSVTIPEQRNEFCNKKVGATKVKVPCIQTRKAMYRIMLNMEYPNNLSKNLEKQITNCAKSSSDIASGVIASTITAGTPNTPMEVYAKAIPVIPEALRAMSRSFTQCAKGNPEIAAILNRIKISIREEKEVTPWFVED